MAAIARDPTLFPPFVAQRSLTIGTDDDADLPLFAGLELPAAMARAAALMDDPPRWAAAYY
jgi:hypothetical protein